MSSLVYGIHTVQAILTQHPERFIQLFFSKDRHDSRLQVMIDELNQLGIPIQYLDKKELDQKYHQAHLSSSKSKNKDKNKERSRDKQTIEPPKHQGVLALVQPAKSYNENDLELIIKNTQDPIILILDNITDPHNLGACLRSADAAGVCCVITPKDRSATLTATAIKVSCGASETIPLIRVTNLARTIKLLQENNIWIVGAAGEATHSLYETQLKGGVAVVMGAEGSGLRRLTRELCDELISIPMQGSVSSLNVSVATGICLFEILRQRNFQK